MSVPFDYITSQYDSRFTDGLILQLQRKRVWQYLEKITSELPGLEILELNCGTGEDAEIFGNGGVSLIATDISEEMLKVTQQKVQQYSLQHHISSHYIDPESFDDTTFNKKFDLIFSNFGVLNRISPQVIQKLIERLPSVLNPEGRFVAVIMTQFCLWETIYHLATLRFKKAFQRMNMNNFDGGFTFPGTKVWYHKPGLFRKWSKEKFDIIRKSPVGLALPPVALESVFYKRKNLILKLNKLEKKLSGLSFLSAYADHCIIDLKRN